MLVVIDAGPHDDGQPEMAAGCGAFPTTRQAEAEPEVRVVVDRVDLDRPSELPARVSDPAGLKVRAPQRLADRALLGFEVAGLLERDRGRMGMLTVEEVQPSCVGVVCVLAHPTPPFHVRQSGDPTPRAASPTRIVPDFIPFSGLRYAGVSELSRLAAPPYDVIDEAEHDRLEALDLHNAVRLILPREEDGHDRYRVAARRLETWCAGGVLERDPRPTFTILRMRFALPGGPERATLGVVGSLRLPDTAGDGVLPHERTMANAKTDRLALLRATRANLDPIWGLSLADGLSGLLAPAGPPDAVCTDESGATHEAWIVDRPDRIDAITEAIGAFDLVIADGHHRLETAMTYRAETDLAGAERIMTFVVELAEDQLCIRSIHRLVRLPPATTLRAALAEGFDLFGAGPNVAGAARALLDQARRAGGLGLVDAEGCALARPRPETLAAVARAWERPVDATDAALVDAAVVPALGDAAWEYRHDEEAVAAAVRNGEADAALLLRPVDVATTRAVAEAGLRMPPKTTFFAPKPRTGFVFRTLDDDDDAAVSSEI